MLKAFPTVNLYDFLAIIFDYLLSSEDYPALMSKDYDVLIIGAGPGGSTAAALLAKQGIRTAIVEKDEFPRFKIGESLLPYSTDILRKSGAMEVVDSGKYIRKYGAQFIDHRFENEIYFEFKEGLDSDHPYAFEVVRSEFDKDLLEYAKSLGVDVFQPESVKSVLEKEEHIELQTTERTLTASYVIDASGRNALMGRKKKLRSSTQEFNNIAVFTHFKNTKRGLGEREGDITIGVLPDHCWSWIIPFKGNECSVGIVLDAKKHSKAEFTEDLIREKLSCHPKFNEILENAESIRPVQMASNYSERCSELTGPRWLLLGDAAGFLDPVFSSGVHIALKSADIASEVLTDAVKTNRLITETELGQNYANDLFKGMIRFRSLLRLFYHTDFVSSMQKVLHRPNTLRAFTSAVGGDMWNDKNPLFSNNVL